MVKDATVGPLARRVAVTVAAMVAMLLAATAAEAYQTSPGWVASDYVTGFPHGAAAGPVGLAFDGSGNLLVAGGEAGTLNKVPPGGGTAGGTRIRGGYGQAEGLAFDKTGRLYMARGNQHDVVELNPASGAVIRTVVGGLPCPVALATDPISGDLFVSNVFCPGGGIKRIKDFQSGPGVATNYAGTQDADGLTFAPDGTLYAAGGTKIVRIAGTGSSTPGAVSDVADVPEVDGIVYAPATAQSDQYLVVNRNDGEIDRVDFDGRVSPVLTGGSRGDLVTVGPDRCMYADLQDRVIKLGPSTGTCGFAAPVQPSLPAGGVLAERAAARVVDTAVKASAPRSVRRGSRFTLTLTASDKSGRGAHTVVLTDKLPKGARFLRARSARGVRCRAKRRTLTCRKATLGAKRSFTVEVVMRSRTGSTYTNTASVKSHDLDPSPGNNRARTQTKVRRGKHFRGA